jgi:carbohydrate esterase-like sialic acid-specific acetylesterase
VICGLSVLGAGVRPASSAVPIRVYIFAGQSNMTGAATMAAQLPTVAPDLQVPKNLVSFWGPTTDSPRQWAPLQAPTEVWKNIFREGFGPELSAGRSLMALHPGSRIAVLKFAWNATSLHWDWNPKRAHSLYETSMVRAKVAMQKLAAQTGRPLRISGFFWMQGESDSDTLRHATAYGRNLETFISSVRRDLHAPGLPFVIGQIDDVRKYHPVSLRFSAIVRAEQRRVAEADPHAFLVSTKGLGHNPVSRVHFNSEGTVELGRRFVRKAFGL